MGRIKVFYFIPNLQQGGPERQVLQLIRQLPERFEPVLCVYHDNVFFDRDLPPGQPRYVLDAPKMGLAALVRLTRILRQERPQIVHSYRDKANFWARIAALRAGVPIIVTACRNRMMQLRYLLVERALASRCQLVLTNSVGVREELTTLAGVDPRQIRVIYNFLDLELFRPPTAAERAEARRRWSLDATQPALLLPGRIGLQKHQLGLLLALETLARQGRLPEETVLLLAGRDRDQRVARLVRQAAARPHLRDHVRFVGAQKDIRSLYWASDILVMPSLYEGLSNAALEACACGLPAILSHAANVDGIVAHGETGLEVPTADRGTLTAALDRMLRLGPDGWRALGQRGRDRMAARFAPSEAAVREQMVGVYDELLAAASIAAQ